jgi:hypothetical protein
MIFPKSPLCFLGSLNPVPNDYFWHLKVHGSWLFPHLAAFWAILTRTLQSVGLCGTSELLIVLSTRLAIFYRRVGS